MRRQNENNSFWLFDDGEEEFWWYYFGDWNWYHEWLENDTWNLYWDKNDYAFSYNT